MLVLDRCSEKNCVILNTDLWLTQIIANPGHQHFVAVRPQQNDLYAEVGDPNNLAGGGAGVETSLISATSFNNNTMQDPAPYATTALAMQNRLQTVSTRP